VLQKTALWSGHADPWFHDQGVANRNLKRMSAAKRYHPKAESDGYSGRRGLSGNSETPKALLGRFAARNRRRQAVTLIQWINLFLLHSWLATAPPFTPIQNPNLLIAISSCASPDLVPVSELRNVCGNSLNASTGHRQAVSFDIDR